MPRDVSHIAEFRVTGMVSVRAWIRQKLKVIVAVGILVLVLTMCIHFEPPTMFVHYKSLVLNSSTVHKKVLFQGKPLVIWSNDFHISPINDLKDILQPLGVRFIDKSLSGHCHITKTCEGRKSLRVINVQNAMDLADSSLIQRFYDEYRNDVEMQSVDAFVCFHPTAMCELFMKFNRSIIVIASTRYELGRFHKERWTLWNENLAEIAKGPSNVVAGNNLYDVEYIRYFTGLAPQLLPSFCGYRTERYAPLKPGFILAPMRQSGFENTFMAMYGQSCVKFNCTETLFPLRNRYPHYEYSDLTAHRGIVYVPYQVSVMSLFEQYRMNIPLFFPSVKLLTDWQLQYMVMRERTWDGVGGKRPVQSAIAAHPSQRHLPDPNNEQNRNAVEHWIKFADFYQMPHIQYYDSVDDLVNKLKSLSPTALMNISEQMNTFNIQLKDELTSKWKTILNKIAESSPNRPH